LNGLPEIVNYINLTGMHFFHLINKATFGKFKTYQIKEL